jgi:hypothetical protein
MAPLFSTFGSGEVKEYVGYVRTSRPARGDDFAGYADLGVSVNTAAKGAEQYAPSVFLSVHSDDESIGIGDKVLVKGLLRSRTDESGEKIYYSLDRYTLFPVVVLEKAKAKDGAATTKTATKSAAPAQDDNEDDF